MLVQNPDRRHIYGLKIVFHKGTQLLHSQKWKMFYLGIDQLCMLQSHVQRDHGVQAPVMSTPCHIALIMVIIAVKQQVQRLDRSHLAQMPLHCQDTGRISLAGC